MSIQNKQFTNFSYNSCLEYKTYLYYIPALSNGHGNCISHFQHQSLHAKNSPGGIALTQNFFFHSYVQSIQYRRCIVHFDKFRDQNIFYRNNLLCHNFLQSILPSRCKHLLYIFRDHYSSDRCTLFQPVHIHGLSSHQHNDTDHLRILHVHYKVTDICFSNNPFHYIVENSGTFHRHMFHDHYIFWDILNLFSFYRLQLLLYEHWSRH